MNEGEAMTSASEGARPLLRTEQLVAPPSRPDSPAQESLGHERRPRRRWVVGAGAAALTLATIAGVFGFKILGSDTESDAALRPTASPSAGELLPSDGEIIADVTQRPTAEQIAYVSENPVTDREYPLLADQIEQLGLRWNVAINNCELDLDQPPEVTKLTAESQAQFDELVSTFIDTTSPEYASMTNGMIKRGGQVGAMFTIIPNATSTVRFELDPETPSKTTGNTTTAGVLVYWDSNQPAETTADGRYKNDYSGTITLIKGRDGAVKVADISNITDIGDIG